MPLGTFDLAPGQNHRVVLSDDANEYVIGDAVKFVLETNARAVVADAIRIVGESAPAGDFAATASTVLREYVTLGGRPLALIEGGQIRYVHPDHLGTPQKMTDGTGALVWDAVYKPFGEAHAITGTATNNQRFPGQLYDPETGYHYNYFRDYAPGLGRYTESDPIGLWGGLNTYAYVGGNPFNYIDAWGLARRCSRPLEGSGGIIVGPLRHDQILYDDGTDSGFFNTDEIGPDKGHDRSEYTCAPEHFDDDEVRRAEAEVQSTWDRDWRLFTNNCQDYVNEVLAAIIHGGRFYERGRA